jgi:DNA-directed RNA polymerase subunit beta'
MDAASGNKMIHIQHIAVQEDVYVRDTSADKVKVKDGVTVKKGDLIMIRKDGTEVLAEHDGLIKAKSDRATVIWEGPGVTEYIVPAGFQVLVKDGTEVQPGDQLTEGHLDLLQLYRLKGKSAVMRYILREVLSIYASQGQKINAKHIETMVRQMFSRFYVKDAGDTDLLPGEVVEASRAREENERVAATGGALADVEELFMGVTKVSLSTESFLSAASFQETARVLINAAVTGKIDRLEGLKENVIIGRLIPAGTGFGDRDPKKVVVEEEVEEEVV